MCNSGGGIEASSGADVGRWNQQGNGWQQGSGWGQDGGSRQVDGVSQADGSNRGQGRGHGCGGGGAGPWGADRQTAPPAISGDYQTPPPVGVSKSPSKVPSSAGSSSGPGVGTGNGTNTGTSTGSTAGVGAVPNWSATPAVNQWAGGAAAASYVTGNAAVTPQLVGGMVWAESRGNPNEKSTNVDGSTDTGLMQISQQRWTEDVLPNLTADQRARIVEVTGLQPEQLDMNNPQHNLIGGALEVSQAIQMKGGSVEQGLNYYVSGDLSGVGSPTYVQDVLSFSSGLAKNTTLKD